MSEPVAMLFVSLYKPCSTLSYKLWTAKEVFAMLPVFIFAVLTQISANRCNKYFFRVVLHLKYY